mmetsp:Transcript_27858/g.90844  ORF Transcript_27858/g.90844 Transcript_27858/m.90844 type:complete len:282 (-) Transcript_27858:138-983(-)
MGITAPTCRSACAAHLVARAAHTLTQRHTPAAPTLRVLVYSHQTIWVAPSGRAERPGFRPSSSLHRRRPLLAARRVRSSGARPDARRREPRTRLQRLHARVLRHEHSGEGPAPASLEPADAVRVLPPAAEEGGAPDGRLHLEPRARRVVEEGEGAAVKVRPRAAQPEHRGEVEAPAALLALAVREDRLVAVHPRLEGGAGLAQRQKVLGEDEVRARQPKDGGDDAAEALRDAEREEVAGLRASRRHLEKVDSARAHVEQVALRPVRRGAVLRFDHLLAVRG